MPSSFWLGLTLVSFWAPDPWSPAFLARSGNFLPPVSPWFAVPDPVDQAGPLRIPDRFRDVAGPGPVFEPAQ
eukprot:753281-Heterocapsa_arctica.AAC.1